MIFSPAILIGVLLLVSCAKKEQPSEEWLEFRDAVSAAPTESAEVPILAKPQDENKYAALIANLSDTMYIGDIAGAKVRLEPNAESVIIAELPYNASVKILGAEADCAKVNVPRYLRQDGKDEGYISLDALAKTKNPLKTLPEKWRAKNLQEYLESSAWKKAGVLKYWIFATDGTFSFYTPDTDDCVTGKWRAVSGSSIEISREESATNEALRVKIQDANNCVIGSDSYESKFSLEQLTSTALDTPILYSTDSMGYTLLEYAALMDASSAFVDSLIKAGVAPGISPYRAEYDEYWGIGEKRKAAVALDWQDLGEGWADDYEFLYSAADIDGDGADEGLYCFRDGRKYELALIKSAEQKCATLFLSAPASYDKAKNPWCELLFPYTLAEKKIFVRIVSPAFFDALYVVKDGGELETVFDEEPKNTRKILFSENSAITIDIESNFGVISADNAKIYPIK